MKGIILAGGLGTRLAPMTKVVSKQLLPIYDKPMIYYPLSTLMLAGIREILLITTPNDLPLFRKLFGDGSRLGLQITYAQQEKPLGLAHAFIVARNFLSGDSCLMILGDNIFHGVGLGIQLRNSIPKSGAHIFSYPVSDPTSYGIVTLNHEGLPVFLEEKPKNSKSNLAITGLYFFDGEVTELVQGVKESARGELEIISLLELYLLDHKLSNTQLGRGIAWLDTGTPKGINDASSYIRVIEERTGLKIGCVEEVAWRNKWISDLEISSIVEENPNSEYGVYLKSLLHS